jgi:hypothetical protein
MDKPIPEAVRARVAQLREAIESEPDHCFGVNMQAGRAYDVRQNLLCIVGLIEDSLTAAQQPDHIVDATKMVAQQQGQAVSGCCRNAGTFACTCNTFQPMQQGGGEAEFKERVADILPRGATVSDPEAVAERLLRAHAASFTAPPSAPVGVKLPKPVKYPKPDESGNETGTCCAHAYADGWNGCLRAAKEALAQQPAAIPQLANCGRYTATDNNGQHYYLNHANTWQTFQGQQPAAVDGAMTRRIMSEFHANDPGDVWPPDEQGRLRRKALQDAINNVLATQHQEPTT